MTTTQAPDLPEDLADRLDRHQPLWAEDRRILRDAARLIRQLRADRATLRDIADRQMKMIARLASNRGAMP